MLSRPRWAAIGAATTGLVAFAIWALVSGDGPAPTQLAGHVGAAASSAFALGCAVTTAWRGRGPQRTAWAFLTLGLAAWSVGDLIRLYLVATSRAELPFPSIVDATRLLLPIAAFAAVFFVPTGGRPKTRIVLDGAIVASSLFLVAWALGLNRLYGTGEMSPFQFAVAATYPFASLALLTMILVVAVRVGPGRRVAPGLLAIGLIPIGLADTANVYFDATVPHQAIVLGWMVGMYFIGFAALTSTTNPMPGVASYQPPSRIALWLPYSPVPFAIVFGTVAVWSVAGLRPVIVAVVLLVLATVIRQFTLLAENRKLLVAVAEMALRDPLTGLSNRVLFADRLAHAMQLRQRNAASVNVLLLDLDDFKLVNDSLGHAAGDALLSGAGRRIHDNLRTGDTVARLGGDEFAILVEDEPDIARAVADRIVAAFRQPFTVDGRDVYVHPSVGLASASATDDLSGDDLFRRADLAMYAAKRSNVSGVRAFTPDMRHDATELRSSLGSHGGHRDGVAQIQLLGDLREAIQDRRLTLLYQPKISLATGAAVGVEALVRWPHPDLGLLEPADFLPLVRRNGLTSALTDLVLSRAVEEAAGWYRAGLTLPVAINLPAPALEDEALPERILAVLAEHHMPADSLSVEITEDLLLTDVVRTRAVLYRLRDNGIRIAIDDFGSGYAAMTYLHELPIDELKLDRQFVTPILYDERAAMIVRAIIELANAFELTSVAEGVEDQATADRLKDFGCGYVQGHAFSPPVSAEAIRSGVGLPRPTVDVTPTVVARPFSA